ncbi:MAG: autotransporter-associated beta strand repeat-containing protein, partial [Opitutales bacterium]
GTIENGSGSNTTALTKVGPSMLTLAGTSSFTGATTISGGTLLLTGSFSGTSAVNINSGGTLGGTGSVTSAATVTLASGAILAPGLGLGNGVLTLPNLTWTAGGNLTVGVIDGTSSDTIDLGSGALTASGTGNFDISFDGATLDAPGTYTIISYGSETGFVAGNFTATDVTINPAYIGAFNITTSGPGSLTFDVTAVPEPAVYGLALGGVALLLGLRRRRQVA